MFDARKHRFSDGEELRMAVAKNCPASWANMTGNDQVRHCSRCDRYVYNLSEMTKAEALELIDRVEGPMCIRFKQRLDGKVLTRDCGLAAKVGWSLKWAAASVLSLVGLGCIFTPVYAGAAVSPRGAFQMARFRVKLINEQLRTTTDPEERKELLKERQREQKRMRQYADDMYKEG